MVEAARWAARGDPRFLGVEPGELAAMEIDVSILGPLVRLADPSAFRPGTDGMVVAGAGGEACCCPRSPTPWARAHRDARRVLPEGGLPGDAWREPGTELWVFRTHRFGGPAA